MATLLSNQTQKTKHYQTDQQVKYLHLEAEVEMLLQRLTALMQRQLSIPLTSESSKIDIKD
ncbi:MAG TPA: hypothetical protein V6C71_26405 [Coleofasciculaceae cyanobacterium]|jgi:hypothetical protein